MLQKQKLKTGTAILGSPLSALNQDPKYQGHVLTCSLLQGEALAQIALAAEILTLTIAQVPQKDWYRYIGRSQYPKFQIKTLCRSNSIDPLQNVISLRFWATVKGLAAQCNVETVESKKNDFAPELLIAVTDIGEHGSIFSEEQGHSNSNNNSESNISYNQFLQYISSQESLLANCRAIVTFASYANQHICHLVVAESALAWRTHIREQLYKGGGSLFKYISKEDKLFANVELKDSDGSSMSPDSFLASQNDKWSVPWTLDPEQTEVLVACLTQARADALEDFGSSPREFSLDTFDKGLHRYRKSSIAGDIWSPAEFRSLPKCCRQELADNIQQAFISLSWAHQQLYHSTCV